MESESQLQVEDIGNLEHSDSQPKEQPVNQQGVPVHAQLSDHSDVADDFFTPPTSPSSQAFVSTLKSVAPQVTVEPKGDPMIAGAETDNESKLLEAPPLAAEPLPTNRALDFNKSQEAEIESTRKPRRKTDKESYAEFLGQSIEDPNSGDNDYDPPVPSVLLETTGDEDDLREIIRSYVRLDPSCKSAMYMAREVFESSHYIVGPMPDFPESPDNVARQSKISDLLARHHFSTAGQSKAQMPGMTRKSTIT